MKRGAKPDKIPDGSGKTVEDYWGPSKRIMGEPKFVDELNAFEKDDINAKTMKLIRDKNINNKDESKISMGAVDAVAKCLHKWLLAIESYDKIAKSVAPKKEVMSPNMQSSQFS